jgi:hypothetical protein
MVYLINKYNFVGTHLFEAGSGIHNSELLEA